jgi:hypothetical protein
MQSGFTSIRYAPVGTPLPAITKGPVVWPVSPGAAANAVQTITIAASAGTFTLTWGGKTTVAIDYDAVASEVEDALENLESIGEGNVSVTGSIGGPYIVEFIRDLGNQAVALIEADATNLNGGTATVAETTPGTAGGGLWLPVPNIDPEKDVQLVPDATVRSLYSPGSARPTMTHIIRVAIAEIQLVTTESALKALEFIFPAFTKSGNSMALSTVSKETPYVALALEVPEGVFEFKKVAPDHETQINLLFSDITQPEFTLIVHEDANRDVGFFHEFTS